MRFIRQSFALLLTLATLCIAIARAQDEPHGFNTEIASDLFGVDTQGLTLASDGGDPPAVKVRKAGQLIGYLASTWQVARTVGYSGKPIDIIVAVRVDGALAGARLIRQSEPVLTIGISPSDIAEFVDGFADMNVVSKQPDAGDMRTIAGATVSSGVIADGIMRASRSAWRSASRQSRSPFPDRSAPTGRDR